MEVPTPPSADQPSIGRGADGQHVREISRDRIIELVADMEREGFAVLSGYLEPAELESLRQFVETAVAAAGAEYVVFTEQETVAGTLIDKLAASPAFVKLLHRVYEQSSGHVAPNQSLYQVLRCLKGKSGLKHAFYFHYDSYVVTALLPVIIPSQGNAGHLVMAPNWRPVRSSYLVNLLDKVILDTGNSVFTPARVQVRAAQAKADSDGTGNLYLFWGYRSVHANEPCDPDKIRATALFHFGDPHADSGLRRFTGRAKSRSRVLTDAQ